MESVITTAAMAAEQISTIVLTVSVVADTLVYVSTKYPGHKTETAPTVAFVPTRKVHTLTSAPSIIHGALIYICAYCVTLKSVTIATRAIETSNRILTYISARSCPGSASARGDVFALVDINARFVINFVYIVPWLAIA